MRSEHLRVPGCRGAGVGRGKAVTNTPGLCAPSLRGRRRQEGKEARGGLERRQPSSHVPGAVLGSATRHGGARGPGALPMPLSTLTAVKEI